MKLTAKELQIVQNCANAEELVKKAAEDGKDISVEQAQKLIDSVSMVDVDENDLDTAAAGAECMVKCYYCEKVIPGTSAKKAGPFAASICQECGDKGCR